jgi:hypothetical protein
MENCCNVGSWTFQQLPASSKVCINAKYTKLQVLTVPKLCALGSIVNHSAPQLLHLRNGATVTVHRHCVGVALEWDIIWGGIASAFTEKAGHVNGHFSQANIQRRTSTGKDTALLIPRETTKPH